MSGFKMRGSSRYHGCLSFLEYTGFDLVGGTFFFRGEELAVRTPGEMQANFMNQRWGRRNERNTKMAVYGPGSSSGAEEKPPTTPPPNHRHNFADMPIRLPDGSLGFPCTDSNCDYTWKV